MAGKPPGNYLASWISGLSAWDKGI